jgi:hypothetical protein
MMINGTTKPSKAKQKAVIRRAVFRKGLSSRNKHIQTSLVESTRKTS